MGVGFVKIVRRVMAYPFLLSLTFSSLSLFVTALRESTLLLEPPFGAKFGMRWRFAVNEAERGVAISISQKGIIASVPFKFSIES